MESSNTLGRYQIIREIARSNDVIYEAVDPAINRRVALKELCLPPNLTGAQKRERIERFYREAKAAGKLSHPNIVTIYGAGEEHGRYYIAMEYLEGQDLQDVLRVRGALPVQEAQSIVLQVCDALAYAHQQGVIHRDIKPDNIQILAGNVVKITDFGIARLMNEASITTDGQVFGTPSYMSPEQVAGKPLDNRTDIFSLGVVLYEMLVGRKPFAGDSVVTITYNIMNLEPAPPPGLPPYLSNVLRKSLAKDPNQRYSSTSEMAEDLRNERGSAMPFAMTGQFDAQSIGGYGGTIYHPPAGQTPGGYQDPVAYPPPGGYGPSGGYQPQAPAPPHDPFGNLKPGDIPLPPLPRKPLVSPDVRAFFVMMGVALTLIGLFLFALWALNTAYQNYVASHQETKAYRDLELANKALGASDYDTAIHHYDRVLAIAPKSKSGDISRKSLAVCYIGKGAAHYRSGDMINASADFHKSLSYNPESASAHYWLGLVARQSNREDEALEEWEKAAKIGGSEESTQAAAAAASVYYNRGIEAQRNGDADAALKAWTKVVEVAPGTKYAEEAQKRIMEVGASTGY